MYHREPVMSLPVAGQLPASKTPADRRWSFVANDDAVQPGLGTLSIVQGRRDLDSYAIDTNDIGRGCVEVLFAKKDDAAEVYAVTCNPAGSPVSCTCPGFLFGKRRGIVCKHATAVQELVADGVIETRPVRRLA
jgi:hypothetical protein